MPKHKLDSHASTLHRRPHKVLRALFFCGLAGLSSAGCDSTGSNGNSDMNTLLPDMTPPSRFGFVRAASATDASGNQTVSYSSASAMFVDTTQPGAGCARQVVGECALYFCTGTGYNLPHAGNITISGGAAQPVTLTARADGSYDPQPNTSNVIFPPGQKLVIEAAGQSVPPFHSEVTPPGGNFALTNPDGGRLSIVFDLSRKKDFQLTWTALAPGSRVHAELNQDIESNQGRYLECDFDGARGQGMLPAALLGHFNPTMAPLHNGNLLIGPAATSKVFAGSYEIVSFALTGGRTAQANITDN